MWDIIKTNNHIASHVYLHAICVKISILVSNVHKKWAMILKIINVFHALRIVQHVMEITVYNVKKDFTYLVLEKNVYNVLSIVYNVIHMDANGV